VKDTKEFEKRLFEEFDYMVNPLVFDLSLKLSTQSVALKEAKSNATEQYCYFEIEKVSETRLKS